MRPRATQGILLAAFLCLLVAGSVWLFMQRYWWLTPLASEHGGSIDRLFYVSLAISGVLFILLQASLAVLVARFRDRGADTGKTPVRRGIENRFAAVAAILILAVDVTIFTLGESAWFKAWGAAPPGTAIVEVNAGQFIWYFRYPGKDGEFGKTSPTLITPDNAIGLDEKDAASKDDIVVANELHLVEHEPVALKLRSKDVIHSFYVPNLRVKQDVVPGMQVQVSFVPTRKGEFEIACNQLCGLMHYRMRGRTVVQSREEFNAWLLQMAPQTEAEVAQ